ncbi:hypothetical protein HZS_4886 [Henneguya salminicola]|nr:hypothetical protein HZS_4886 [Henneguya salminicola]
MFNQLLTDFRALSVEERTKNDLSCCKNFWEPGSFATALKRTESSIKLIDDLMQMFGEISLHEVNNGKQFVRIGEKWRKIFDSHAQAQNSGSIFYGTYKSALYKFTDLLEEKGRAHVENWSEIQSKCVNVMQELNDSLNKEHGFAKHVKSLKEDFQTTQRPYTQIFSKFKKARQQYFQYCLSLKPDWDLKNNSDVFGDIEPKKNQKRIKLQKRYEEWHNQLTLMIPHYEMKMQETFGKCDDIEKLKLEKIKQAFSDLRNILSLESNSRHTNFLQQFEEMLQLYDVESDLGWWYNTHGPGSGYDFFQTEEFNPKESASNKPQLSLDDVSLSTNVEKNGHTNGESKS